MPNPVRRGWKYLLAMVSGKIDEKADPRIQIQQAIEAAQRQHSALTQQAAAVIGNQHQLQLKLSRQFAEVDKLQGSARQSLVLADQARAAGDEDRAGQYERTAQVFATQLVAAEQSMDDLKVLHDQALGAAQAAKRAVESNAMIVQQRIAERSKLLTQLDAAKMQEQVAYGLASLDQLQAPGDTPTLDEVREKIEKRYARALGEADLAASSVEGRMLEVQRLTLDAAGTARLDQIRASISGDVPVSIPSGNGPAGNGPAGPGSAGGNVPAPGTAGGGVPAPGRAGNLAGPDSVPAPGSTVSNVAGNSP
jgi:phage shock protein A